MFLSFATKQNKRSDKERYIERETRIYKMNAKFSKFYFNETNKTTENKQTKNKTNERTRKTRKER